jgi:8-oxo-dGTP diphosphatase
VPLKPSFCLSCGGVMHTQYEEGRDRDVCPACGFVYYQNPLPVASAVVLSPSREVLLVKRKRDPYKGMWCLPIGFAELEETIGAAALRELKEEAGIDGRVIRLLDADSYQSDFYGDLLIVTFEVLHVGGRETPGDDADAVAYFPLDGLPPLAFSSNHKAVRACAAAHQEEWVIQDSFQRLTEGHPDGLLSDALVSLIRDHAGEIARLWIEDIRQNPTTESYRAIPLPALSHGAAVALSQVGLWLAGDRADEEIREFFSDLGAVRATSGTPLHELISTLTLLKMEVWTFARQHGVWERPVDVYRVLELNRRLGSFFDKAIYHAARGFAGADGTAEAGTGAHDVRV